MEKLVSLIFSLLIILQCAAVEVPFLKSAPLIDGSARPGEWANASSIELVEYKSGKIPENPTEIRLGYDNENFYILFDCSEKQMDKILAEWKFAEERDNSIWKDDSVELLIDPQNSGIDCPFHIIINPNGIIYDALNSSKKWNSSLRTAVYRNKDSWTVEIAIPFSDFDFYPKGGETWRCNFGRVKHNPGEISCVKSGEGGFSDSSHFKEFYFEPKDANAPSLKLVSSNEKAKHRVIINLPKEPSGNYKIKLITFDRNSVPFKTIEQSTKAGSIEKISYKPASPDGKIALMVTAPDGSIVYYNTFSTVYQKDNTKARTRKIKEPLYSELLSDEPVGLAKDGVIFWFHGSDETAMRKFALQYGIPYSFEDFMQEVVKNKLRPIGGSYTLKLRDEISKKLGCKWLFCPTARYSKTPKQGIFPFMPDPEAQEAYFNDLKQLKDLQDNVWGVYIGDEIVAYQQKIGIEFFNDKKLNYPYIKQADEEVKRAYGDGKYGIPHSKDDPNVYRWIAYRRWLNDKLQNFMRRVYREVKSINPDLVVVSDDPMAMHNLVYDFSGFNKLCDIATHQLYPRNNPDYEFSGFLTKYLKDLSGSEEVWPCVHVEEYAASYTPSEVLDMISDVLRNGGNGIHFYLCDTVGRRAGKKYMHSEYFGAPDRWQTEMAAVNHIAEMNKLKFPEPDCALFCAVDTLRATPAYSTIKTDSPVLHSFLGPHAGVWFKFINENLLKPDELRKYKVIFVNDAKYLDLSALRSLARYVKEGGKLVVFDPEAFYATPLGKKLNKARKELLGCGSVTPVKQESMLFEKFKLKTSILNCYKFEDLEKIEIAASFADGSPAVLTHKFGKGQTWIFAVNPNKPSILSNPDWRRAIKSFCENLGLKTDRKIWRFRLPESLIKPMNLPSGKCLTNNAAAWRQCRPVTVFNDDVKGSYNCSPYPDEIADQGGSGNIEFNKGDLTDRLKAPEAGNVDCGKSELDDWVVSWKLPTEINITFDLKDLYSIDRIEIYYQGFMRNITLGLSEDGNEFQKINYPLNPSDNLRSLDVRVKKLTLPSNSKAHFIKLSFEKPEDKTNAEIILAEVEIWSK